MSCNCRKRIVLSIFLFSLFFLSVHCDDFKCYEQSACYCKLDNESFIDLSGVTSQNYLSVSSSSSAGALTYYFFPCKDEKVDPKALNLSVEDKANGCIGGSSLCLYNATTKSLINLSNLSGFKFTDTYPKSIISKTNTSNILTSSIYLVCTPLESEPYLEFKHYESDNHQLLLFSSHACLRYVYSGLSTGSKLLIMVSIIFGTYFLGGAVSLHCLRGAQGKEMIPNVDFWTDLPNLVKLCLYNATTKSLINLSNLSGFKFTDTYPKSIISKTNTSNILTSSIYLVCTPLESEPYLEFKHYESDNHQLLLFSSHACLRYVYSGLSTGSKLLIMVSIIFGTYFLGGAVSLHCLRGAQGKEMIPNVDFWTDLPNLVKDGCVYLLSGCNPLAISTAETYDRI